MPPMTAMLPMTGPRTTRGRQAGKQVYDHSISSKQGRLGMKCRLTWTLSAHTVYMHAIRATTSSLHVAVSAGPGRHHHTLLNRVGYLDLVTLAAYNVHTTTVQSTGGGGEEDNV